MAEFIKMCPHCNANLRVQDEWIGRNVRCPKCRKQFTISDFPKQEPDHNEQSEVETAAFECSNVQEGTFTCSNVQEGTFTFWFVSLCMTFLAVLFIAGLPICFILIILGGWGSPLWAALTFWAFLLIFILIIYFRHKRKKKDIYAKDSLIRSYIVAVVFCICGYNIEFYPKESTSVVKNVSSPRREPVRQMQPKPVRQMQPEPVRQMQPEPAAQSALPTNIRRL